MENMYFQVIGPNQELNEKFVEKIANKKYPVLNDFHITTKKEFDSNAHVSYFIFSDNIKYTEQEEWMEFYYNNPSMIWVKEF
jgi:hypothetical protein